METKKLSLEEKAKRWDKYQASFKLYALKRRFRDRLYIEKAMAQGIEPPTDKEVMEAVNAYLKKTKK